MTNLDAYCDEQEGSHRLTLQTPAAQRWVECHTDIPEHVWDAEREALHLESKIIQQIFTEMTASGLKTAVLT